MMPNAHCFYYDTGDDRVVEYTGLLLESTLLLARTTGWHVRDASADRGYDIIIDTAQMQACYCTLWLAPFEDAPAAIWPSASIATIAIVSWLPCEGQLASAGPCVLRSAELKTA